MDQHHDCSNFTRQRRGLATLMRRTALAATVCGLACASAAFADDNNNNKPQLVVFGDSLVDAGTYTPVAKAKFDGGRYTTNPGENFTQLVAQAFGDNLTPAFLGGYGVPLRPAGGLDYAQGGSRVTMQPGFNHAAAGTPNADFAAATTIPVKDQVDQFLKDHKRFEPNQIIVENGGANDIFVQLTAAQAAGTAAAQQAALQAINQSATDLAGIAGTIVKNGGQHVVVLNMPDIGNVPFGKQSADGGALLTQISQSFNATLTAAIAQQKLGNKVLVIDTFTFTDNTIANFQQLGFRVSNTASACDLTAQIQRAVNLHLDNPTLYGQSLFCSPKTYVSKDADQTYIFADTVHPTTHFSVLIAQFAKKQIDGVHWEY